MCGIGLVFHNQKHGGSNNNNIITSSNHRCACEASCLCEDVISEYEAHLSNRLKHRGPDVYKQIDLPLFDELNDFPGIAVNIKVTSCVLNMRNTGTVTQPIIDENFTLQWNGQIYPYSRNGFVSVNSSHGASAQPPLSHESDTLWLQKHLRQIVSDHLPISNALEIHAKDPVKKIAIIEKIVYEIRNFFENEKIKGSYAFCIVIPKLSVVIYGRDKAGRRSLVRVIGELIDKNNQSRKLLLGISSVGFEWYPRKSMGKLLRIYTEDVSVEGVYYLEVSSNNHWPIGIIEHSHVMEWKGLFLRKHPVSMRRSFDQPHDEKENRTEEILLAPEHPTRTKLPVPSFVHNSQRDTPMEETLCFLHTLYDAVAERVVTTYLPKCESGRYYIGLLFSGGTDSALLAALLHWVIEIEYTFSESERFVIELLNVAFGESPESTPDRISARAALKELTMAFPNREFRLFLIDASDPCHLTRIRSEFPDDHLSHRIRSLVLPSDTVMDLNIGTALWFASTGIGTIALTSQHLQPTGKQRRLHRTAALEPSLAESTEISTSEGENQFDLLRRALLSEFSERCVLTTGEKTRKLPISMFGNDPYSIPYKKYGFSKLVHYMKAAQKAGICEITFDKQKNYWIHPTATLLQQSDPVSETRGASSKTLEKARSRLLFSGLGADETLCGYRRHRNAFHSHYNRDKSPLENLFQALDEDCARLFKRNLGRDCRCCSDNGKEMATPFLDEKVIDCIQHVGNKSTAALWDLDQPDGIGDKKIARTAARMAGLSPHGSTMLIKRAIQFGSRIADRRIKGEEKISNVS